MAQSNRVVAFPRDSRNALFSIQEKGIISWIEKNKSQLLVVVGILFIIVVCSLSFVAYQRYWKATALEELRLGVTEFQDGDIEKAVARLQKAEDLLGFEKKGGKVAAFYLDEAYSRSKNVDRKKIDDFVALKYTSAPQDYLSQIVLLAQGRLAEKENNFVTARKFYEDASSIDGPFTAEALLSAARVAESANDLNAATSFREKFVAAYPNTPFTDIVRDKLRK